MDRLMYIGVFGDVLCVTSRKSTTYAVRVSSSVTCKIVEMLRSPISVEL